MTTRSQQTIVLRPRRRKGTPSLSPDYIVGLVDGEGCFYVLVRQPGGAHRTRRVELHLHIKMKIEDKPVLEKIKWFFGCGGVYYQAEKRSNHTSCYRYTASSLKDHLQVIIPFFKRYPLLTGKMRDFQKFSQIAKMVAKRAHLTERGFKKIVQIKQEMNQRAR